MATFPLQPVPELPVEYVIWRRGDDAGVLARTAPGSAQQAALEAEAAAWVGEEAVRDDQAS